MFSNPRKLKKQRISYKNIIVTLHCSFKRSKLERILNTVFFNYKMYVFFLE